jgi:hypothetical protein
MSHFELVITFAGDDFRIGLTGRNNSGRRQYCRRAGGRRGQELATSYLTTWCARNDSSSRLHEADDATDHFNRTVGGQPRIRET